MSVRRRNRRLRPTYLPNGVLAADITGATTCTVQFMSNVADVLAGYPTNGIEVDDGGVTRPCTAIANAGDRRLLLTFAGATLDDGDVITFNNQGGVKFYFDAAIIPGTTHALAV